MAINTDTPGIYPPTAEDMQQNGFAPPPSEGFAAGPAPRPEYETSGDAFQGEGAAPALDEFASKAMEAPSRYDSGLIKDITGQIDAELEQKKLYAGTELDEFMSQRGMVGSSVEGELRKSMLGDMERQRQERLNELNTRAADAWAADRAGAADIGFKSAEFGRALGGDKENAARYEAEFGQSQYEFDKTYGVNAWSNRIEEKRLELTEEGMDKDDAYRMAMSEIQGEQFSETLGEERAARVQRYGLDMEALENETRRIEGEETGLSMQRVRDQAEINLRLEQLRAQKEEAGEAFEVERERITIQNEQYKDRLGLDQLLFEEQRSARIATMGLSRQELDQSAERLQLDGLLQGRTLDLQEARSLAEIEHRTLELSQTMGLEQARLQASEDQFQAQHSQNTAQWADSLGMQQDQYSEAVAARQAEYGDRSAARLGEMGLQEGTLEHDAMQNSLSRTLEREALELQKLGMDAESAWRAADRIQQERLEDRALGLQESGLTKEDAWRRALNNSNEKMQESQLTSQQTLMDLGIGADKARDATREAHEMAMNGASIDSAEKIEELARILQGSGITAEIAWRAATDASNEARANVDKNGTAAMHKALVELGVKADTAAATAAQGYQLAVDSANNISREGIQDSVNETVGVQLTKETAWRTAQNTHEAGIHTKDLALATDEYKIKTYATEHDLQMREHEFSVATTENRIKMALAAWSTGKMEEGSIEGWVEKYPPPRTPSTLEDQIKIDDLNELLVESRSRADELQEWIYANTDTPRPPPPDEEGTTTTTTGTTTTGTTTGTTVGGTNPEG